MAKGWVIWAVGMAEGIPVFTGWLLSSDTANTELEALANLSLHVQNGPPPVAIPVLGFPGGLADTVSIASCICCGC